MQPTSRPTSSTGNKRPDEDTRRVLHEPRVPPNVFRAYTPKKCSKWPNIQLPAVCTDKWRHIDANVWQLKPPPRTSVHGGGIAGCQLDHNDDHSAAISMAAIAYGQVYPATEEWQPSDVGKILAIGRLIHRTASLRSRADQRASLRPDDLINTFYVDFTKLTTMVAATAADGGGSGQTKNIAQAIRQCLATDAGQRQHGCIVEYDRCRYAAVWPSATTSSSGGVGGTADTVAKNDDWHILYVHEPLPFSHDSSARPHSVRAPARRDPLSTCCLRCNGTDTFERFVTRLLRLPQQPEQQRYRLIGVRILNVQEVCKYPDADPLTCVQWCQQGAAAARLMDDHMADSKPSTPMADQFGGAGGGDTTSAATAQAQAQERPGSNVADRLMNSVAVAPYLMDFRQAYRPLTEGVDILRGFNYVDQTVRIPCTNVAAIAMLRVARSFSWTWDTLEEVLRLGNRIYEENRDGGTAGGGGAIDVLATEVQKPIRIGCGARHRYRCDAEQFVFGRLMSSAANVPDLARALTLLFGAHAAGVVQGPQSVAVWHELGWYYMFDAKERDRCGRKWTMALGGGGQPEDVGGCDDVAVVGGGEVESMGCCCVTRFRNVERLARMYGDTVPLRHRHDTFRVTRVTMAEHQDRSVDWFGWRSTGIGRWIVRGRFSLANERFAADERGGQQATCIAAIALLYSERFPLSGWSSELVDEIVTTGDALHQQSVDELREAEKLDDGRRYLLPSEVSRLFMWKAGEGDEENEEEQKQPVRFEIEEGVVKGNLHPQSCGADGSMLLDLLGGLGQFFESCASGLLTAGESTLAVWCKDNVYYVFDAEARDCNGRNPNTCHSNRTVGHLGTSCAQRFVTLSDFALAIGANIDMSAGSTEYALSRLSSSTQLPDEPKPLIHFKDFSPYDGAAILRSSTGHHEGNHDLFDVRADKQTLCNLLAALCMTHLVTADQWSSRDLYDILKLGERIFVDASVRHGKRDDGRVPDDFRLEWPNIEELSIGNNRFVLRDVQREEATLVGTPTQSSTSPSQEQLGSTDETDGQENVNSDNIAKRNPSIASTSSKRAASKLERLSNSFTRTSKTGGSDGQENDETPAEQQAELRTLLTDYDASIDGENSNSMAIIETDMFQLALWKHEDMFYLFDPQPSDDEAKPTSKRRQRFMRAIAKRNREAAEVAAAAEAEAEAVAEGEAGAADDTNPDGVPADDDADAAADADAPNGERKVSIRTGSQSSGQIAAGDAGANETRNDDEDTQSLESMDLSYSEDTSATCHVIRFATIDHLVEHILQLVPESLHKVETVHLIRPDICPIEEHSPSDGRASTTNVSAVQQFHQFDPRQITLTEGIKSPLWVIHASMSQNDQIFMRTANRNRQDAAICVAALSMASLCQPEDWSPVVLDVVLKYGDRLHSKSLTQSAQQMRSRDAQDGVVEKLKLHQVINTFVMASVRFEIVVELFGSGDLTSDRHATTSAATNQPPVRGVHDVLSDFFDGGGISIGAAGQFAILTARDYSTAIWSANAAGVESIFMFDAHDIGPDGIAAKPGVAALVRCVDLATIASLFVTNVRAGTSATQADENAFQLHRVRLMFSKVVQPVPGLCSAESGAANATGPSIANCAYAGDRTMRLLHGNHVPPASSAKASYAVAAMAFSCASDALFWTARSIDTIMLLGDRVADMSVQSLQQTPTKSGGSADVVVVVRAQQVRKNFCLNVGADFDQVLVHVEMELFQKGTVGRPETGEISLKSGLARFFGAHDYAVLTIVGGIELAIWRKCGYFYCFDAYPSDGGRPRRARPCVGLFETLTNMYQAIRLRIPIADDADAVDGKQRDGWYEIRKCEFTLTPVGRNQTIVSTLPTHVHRRPTTPPVSPAVADIATADVITDDVRADTIRCRRRRRPTVVCFRNVTGEAYQMLGNSRRTNVDDEHFRMHRNQTAAIGLVALAMTMVEPIDRWSSKTLDLVVRSGRRLYADAQRLRGGDASIPMRLHDLPRQICIGEDVRLDVSIGAATDVLETFAGLVDGDDSTALFEFFEQHTMAHLYLNDDTCLMLMRSLNQFYVFSAMPNQATTETETIPTTATTSKMLTTTLTTARMAAKTPTTARLATSKMRPMPTTPFTLTPTTPTTSMCVLRFVNFQRVLEHLKSIIMKAATPPTGGKSVERKALLRPIKFSTIPSNEQNRV